MVKVFHEKLVPEKKTPYLSHLFLCAESISAIYKFWGRSLGDVVFLAIFFKKKAGFSIAEITFFNPLASQFSKDFWSLCIESNIQTWEI